MSENTYLKWLASTESRWWTDSAVYGEMDDVIANGGTGVTTNPLLIKRTLYEHTEFWKPFLLGIDKALAPSVKAEEIIPDLTTSDAANANKRAYDWRMAFVAHECGYFTNQRFIHYAA